MTAPARGGGWRSTAAYNARVRRGVGNFVYAARKAACTERSTAGMPAPDFAEMKCRARPIEEMKLAIELALDGRALVFVEPIPLVHRDHQRPPGLEDESGDMGVLFGDFLGAIEQQDRHVALFDRLQGLDDRELLDRFEHLAPAPQARGVDQRIALAAVFELDCDRIARRSGLIESDQALLAEQRVDECRLADVWPADDRDADLLRGVAPCRSRPVRARIQPGPRPSDRRHRRHVPRLSDCGLAETELVELRYASSGNPSALFTARTSRRPLARRRSAMRSILRRQALARVEHKNHDVALGDRLLGLRRHLAHDALGRDGFETAGVDDEVRHVPRPGRRRSDGRA